MLHEVAALYQQVTVLAAGLYAVVTEQGTGLLGKEGQEVLPPMYDSITLAAPGLLKVMKDGRMGYVRLSDRRFVWQEESVPGP